MRWRLAAPLLGMLMAGCGWKSPPPPRFVGDWRSATRQLALSADGFYTEATAATRSRGRWANNDGTLTLRPADGVTVARRGRWSVSGDRATLRIGWLDHNRVATTETFHRR
jgi:hypothetical protein